MLAADARHRRHPDLLHVVPALASSACAGAARAPAVLWRSSRPGCSSRLSRSLVCAGIGLLVERAAGARLPLSLVLPVGMAGLVCATQLTTYWSWSARLTLPLVVVLALAGLRARAREPPARAPTRCAVAAALGVLAVFAAPVVLSGDATFAGYTVLGDTVDPHDRRRRAARARARLLLAAAVVVRVQPDRLLRRQRLPVRRPDGGGRAHLARRTRTWRGRSSRSWRCSRRSRALALWSLFARYVRVAAAARAADVRRGAARRSSSPTRSRAASRRSARSSASCSSRR